MSGRKRTGERAENYQGSELRRGGLLRRGNGQIGRSYSFTASASRASGSARHHNGDREVRNQSNDSAQHDHSYRRTSPQDHRQYRDRPKSRTGTSSTRIGTTRDVAVRSNLSLQRNNHHSHQTISRRGPAAHDYEVIDSRVLEEGPERTVTISTWREKVANETRRSEVEMSVYYLSADDYVEQDSEYEEREKAKTAGQNGLRHGKEKGKQRDLLNDGWLRSKVRRIITMSKSYSHPLQPVYYGSSSISKAYTPWPSGTNLADITGISRTSSRTKATEKIPIRSTVRDVSLMDWPQREYVEPRTSTPVQRPKIDTIRLVQSSIPQNGPQINRAGRGSSESTISSMHVASNPALEAFLTSCKPPLLYLAPILVGLGIRSNEHLRAVGRLKEETRNKEVREEALKRGMTIMEWAILLDRLQQNG